MGSYPPGFEAEELDHYRTELARLDEELAHDPLIIARKEVVELIQQLEGGVPKACRCVRAGPGRGLECSKEFFGRDGSPCDCSCHEAARRLRLLPNGSIVDDTGRLIARVSYADDELAEAMRDAAERVWQKRQNPETSAGKLLLADHLPAPAPLTDEDVKRIDAEARAAVGPADDGSIPVSTDDRGRRGE